MSLLLLLLNKAISQTVSYIMNYCSSINRYYSFIGIVIIISEETPVATLLIKDSTQIPFISICFHSSIKQRMIYEYEQLKFFVLDNLNVYVNVYNLLMSRANDIEFYIRKKNVNGGKWK